MDSKCDSVTALYNRGILSAVHLENPVMSETYVTDITHYLDDHGELVSEMPGPARKLASFLVLVIDAVSQDIPANDFDTHIRCLREGCTGSIRASLVSIKKNITWSCPDCGHNGRISNWQGTKWNQQTNRIV